MHILQVWAHINHCPKKLSAAGHGHGQSHGGNHHESSSQFPSLNSIPEDSEAPHGYAGHHAPSESASDHCKHLFEHDDQYKNNIVVNAISTCLVASLFKNIFFRSTQIAMQQVAGYLVSLNENFQASLLTDPLFCRWNGFDDFNHCFHHLAAHRRK